MSKLIYFLYSFCIAASVCIAIPLHASETNGTVSSSDKYAWGEMMGWINFAPTNGSNYVGIHINDDEITGYAWNHQHGWINFSPASSGQGVTNTEEGVLGGSAWIAGLGWISMDGVTIDCNGRFNGMAGLLGSDTGRINFDCANCEVRTDWRPLQCRADDEEDEDDPRVPPRTRIPTGGNPEIPLTPEEFPGTTVVNVSGNAGIFQSVVNPSSNPNQADEGYYLLDVRFSLESNVLSQGDFPVAQVAFSNFGTLPPTIKMNFTILDRNAVEVYSVEDSVTVETERVFIKRLQEAKLPVGAYTIRLDIEYGNGVRDSFLQSFQVIAGKTCWMPWPFPWLVKMLPILAWFGCMLPWWVLLFIVCCIIWKMYRWWKHKQLTHEK